MEACPPGAHVCGWELRGEAPGRVRKGRLHRGEKDTAWFSKTSQIWPNREQTDALQMGRNGRRSGRRRSHKWLRTPGPEGRVDRQKMHPHFGQGHGIWALSLRSQGTMDLWVELHFCHVDVGAEHSHHLNHQHRHSHFLTVAGDNPVIWLSVLTQGFEDPGYCDMWARPAFPAEKGLPVAYGPCSIGGSAADTLGSGIQLVCCSSNQWACGEAQYVCGCWSQTPNPGSASDPQEPWGDKAHRDELLVDSIRQQIMWTECRSNSSCCKRF